mmetsp:Transcript_22240/g.35005  ORF Transcript_22240/g.35005 Transcript_22240/m.35005 type:complete len:243 (-) Transcript_22240:164-892(-)
MRADSVEVTTVTYNALLNVYGRASDWVGALQIFRHLNTGYTTSLEGHVDIGGKLWGVRADVVTYNTIMSALLRSDNATQALTLFHHMKASTIRPNVEAYNTLFGVYRKVRHWRSALESFAEMRRYKVERDLSSYERLSAVFEETGRWVNALDLVREMEEERRIQPSKPGPSAKVYNFAIGACKKMGKFPLAVGLVKKMRDSNVMTDDSTFRKLKKVQFRARKPRVRKTLNSKRTVDSSKSYA